MLQGISLLKVILPGLCWQLSLACELGHGILPLRYMSSFKRRVLGGLGFMDCWDISIKKAIVNEV